MFLHSPSNHQRDQQQKQGPTNSSDAGVYHMAYKLLAGNERKLQSHHSCHFCILLMPASTVCI